MLRGLLFSMPGDWDPAVPFFGVRSRWAIITNEAALVDSACLMVFGMLFLVPGLRDWIRAVSSTGWPTTQGVVVSSCLIDTPGARSGGSKRPLVVYRYSVAGIERESTNYQFGPHYWSLAEAQQEVESRSPGSAVTVHYASDDPELACLSPGASAANAIAVVIGLGAEVAGAFIFIRGRRQGGFHLRRRAARRGYR